MTDKDATGVAEIPVRFPPALGRTAWRDGERVPIMEAPVIECGKQTRLGGELVVCIRNMGHPVGLTYGHTNGYKEWCFD